SDSLSVAFERLEPPIGNMLLDVFAEAEGATTLAVVADSRPKKARRFMVNTPPLINELERSRLFGKLRDRNLTDEDEIRKEKTLRRPIKTVLTALRPEAVSRYRHRHNVVRM
ncbi:MAG TPA: hypothetical protein VIM99_14280, partial [Blastocatellia bacterium]